MSQEQQIANHRARLEHALSSGDWDLVGRMRNALKRLFLRAMVRNEGSEVQQILDLLASARAGFALDHGIAPQMDAKSVDAMLTADVETLMLGAELRPAAEALDSLARNAREAVLDALAKANQPLSNRALAQRLSYAEETIARALAALRGEGRVVSLRVGRHTLNTLTVQTSAPPQPVTELSQKDVVTKSFTPFEMSLPIAWGEGELQNHQNLGKIAESIFASSGIVSEMGERDFVPDEVRLQLDNAAVARQAPFMRESSLGL